MRLQRSANQGRREVSIHVHFTCPMCASVLRFFFFSNWPSAAARCSADIGTRWRMTAANSSRVLRSLSHQCKPLSGYMYVCMYVYTYIHTSSGLLPTNGLRQYSDLCETLRSTMYGVEMTSKKYRKDLDHRKIPEWLPYLVFLSTAPGIGSAVRTGLCC